MRDRHHWAWGEDSFTDFRSKGMGSSDMPIIMGESPWKTPYQLWLEKTGIKENTFKGNFATERGNQLEPMVRSWYNKSYGVCTIPERWIHTDKPYFRCNADGVDTQAKKIIEIKCGNLEDHIRAHREGKIPDKYYPQVQFLLWMSGFETIDYVSYNDKLEEAQFVTVTLPLNRDYVHKMLEKAEAFWECVKTKTPPEITDGDELAMDSIDMVKVVTEYDEVMSKMDTLSTRADELKAKISSMVTHKKASCRGWKMNWVTRKGSIDYKKVPDLQNVDLDQYRRPDTKFFTIKRGKDES